MIKAFTLVELLVVIAIIAVLLSLLAPTLDKAVTSAQLAVCFSNQHAIGQALYLYNGDFQQRYPVMDIWWDLVGDKGLYNVDDVTGHPLNVYLGYTSDGSKVPVARCPSDIGDPGADEDPATYIENVYQGYGSSYVQAWHVIPNDPYGIAATKLVFGYNGDAAKYSPLYAQYNTPWTSVKRTSLVRLDNKALNMDWPWHNNRFTYEVRLRWHKPELEERIFSTLFGDGHADLLNMDKHIVDTKYNPGAFTVEYNPSRTWW